MMKIQYRDCPPCFVEFQQPGSEIEETNFQNQMLAKGRNISNPNEFIVYCIKFEQTEKDSYPSIKLYHDDDDDDDDDTDDDDTDDDDICDVGCKKKAKCHIIHDMLILSNQKLYIPTINHSLSSQNDGQNNHKVSIKVLPLLCLQLQQKDIDMIKEIQCVLKEHLFFKLDCLEDMFSKYQTSMYLLPCFSDNIKKIRTLQVYSIERVYGADPNLSAMKNIHDFDYFMEHYCGNSLEIMKQLEWKRHAFDVLDFEKLTVMSQELRSITNDCNDRINAVNLRYDKYFSKYKGRIFYYGKIRHIFGQVNLKKIGTDLMYIGKGMKTFAKYAEDKYSILVKYKDLPLITPRVKKVTDLNAKPIPHFLPELCYFGCVDDKSLHYIELYDMILKKISRVTREIIDLKSLEQRMGFNFHNKATLRQCFVPSNASDEMSLERLEFLGDSVLDLVVSHHLFTSDFDQNEGSMTSARGAIVNNLPLESIGSTLNLSQYLTGESTSKKIHADMMEALVGAIFLDQGLFVATRWCYQYIIGMDFPHPSGHDYVKYINQIVKVPEHENCRWKEIENAIEITITNKALLSICSDDSVNALQFQRLEFLGDRIIKFISAMYHFIAFPNELEGNLTKLSSQSVCNENFRNVAKKLGIEDLFVTKKDKKGKIVSDFIEALFAVIYLDKGGLKCYKAQDLQPLYQDKCVFHFPIYDLYGKFLHRHVITATETDGNDQSSTAIEEYIREKGQEIIGKLLGEQITFKCFKKDEETYSIMVVSSWDMTLGMDCGRNKKEAKQQVMQFVATYLTRIAIKCGLDPTKKLSKSDRSKFKENVKKWLHCFHKGDVSVRNNPIITREGGTYNCLFCHCTLKDESDFIFHVKNDTLHQFFVKQTLI